MLASLRMPLAAAAAATMLALAGPAAAGSCTTHTGQGWAWSLDGAKFQSFEIIEQTTGNWPFGHVDDIRIVKQTCKPDGNGYTCFTTAKVCKKG
ncbi:MAG: hypothetical protein R3D33_12535 [Hyphomicrobiaceae bacterium]